MSLKPRFYQTDAINSVDPLTPGCRKLIVIPTGGGKSYVAGRLASDHSLLMGRVLILAHVKELIVQNAKAVLQADPMVSLGIVCSGIDAAQLPPELQGFVGVTDADITVASIQSVYRKLHLWDDAGLILIDEAHRITPVGGKLYRSVMDRFPTVPIVGLTATPFRMGTCYLHKGEHALFDEICYEITIEELIELGYLVPFATKGSDLAYSDETLKRIGDDFNKLDLQRLVDDGAKTRRIVEQFVQRARERNHWLIFAMNVQHARMIKEYFEELGVSTGILYDGMQKEGLNRDDEIDLFKLGIYRALINVGILTTGFDFPALDCIGIIRPLASVVLYIQIIGRGTRTSPGKTSTLILDYGQNASRFGGTSKIEFKEAKAGKKRKSCGACGELNFQAARYCAACNWKFNEMFRDCPKCNTELDMSARQCNKCDYKFPINESRLDEDGKTIINNTAVWLDISAMKLKVNTPFCPKNTEQRPDCIKITYKAVDGATFDEYTFPESFAARQKFEKWWLDHTGRYNPPKTSAEAVKRMSEIRMPRSVKVIRSGQYINVLSRSF